MIETSSKVYDLVWHASADLPRLATAYQAELFVSTLLGGVYAAADSMASADRRTSVERFVRGFAQHLAKLAVPRAAMLRTVLAALYPQDLRPPARRPSGAPLWLDHVGTARLCECWVYGDEYGDQVGHVATFGYSDQDNGGPEHAVVVLTDRNLGTIKDLYIAAPAHAIVDHLVASTKVDPPTYLHRQNPVDMLNSVAPYLAVLDRLPQLPTEGSLAGDRAMAGARLIAMTTTAGHRAQVPLADRELAKADPETITATFRTSAEADRLIGAPGDGESLTFCLDLLHRYAATRLEPDALRWSPAVVRSFLLEWIPSSAVLDDTDRMLLPRVLDAWVRWSGRLRCVPAAAVARTLTAISRHRESFIEFSKDGAKRSPVTQAVAQMLADGVDPDDEAAVAAWVKGYNSRVH